MNKKYIAIVISVFTTMSIHAQTSQPIYGISGNDIIVNSSFVDPYYIESGAALTPYTLKKTETVIPSSNYGTYSIKEYQFNGYGDLADLFEFVEIDRNGNNILELKTSNGFVPISHYVDTEAKDYSLVQLTVDTYALVFSEWEYDSTPPMTSIVLIHNGIAKLVFNKPYIVESITKQTGSFNMTLSDGNPTAYDSNYVGVDNGKISTVKYQNGVLYFYLNQVVK